LNLLQKSIKFGPQVGTWSALFYQGQRLPREVDKSIDFVRPAQPGQNAHAQSQTQEAHLQIVHEDDSFSKTRGPSINRAALARMCPLLIWGCRLPAPAYGSGYDGRL
jgi:hypothetical protein